MSAIGYYVHWTAAGYNKTGINKQKQKPSIDAIAALQEQKKIIHNKIENYEQVKNTKSLENEINKLLDLLGDRVEPDKKDWDKEARQWIETKLNNEFDNLQRLDFSDASVNYISQAEKGVGKIRTNYTSYKNWRNEVSNRIKELNLYLDNFTKNKNREEYLQAKKRIESLAKGIYKDTYKILRDNSDEEVREEPARNLIKEINNIIQEYASKPAIQLQGGTFFEYILELVPEMGENLANKEVEKRLESYYKGKDKVKVEIDETFFQDKSWKVDLGDITQNGQSSYSQGKIDVAFDWQGQQMNISAKNINLSKPSFISLQKQSSLLYLLQDENSNFVNHYLNLFSRHSGKERLIYANQKNEYFNLLKLTLAYKGLTGESFGRGKNKVNVFVINMRKGTGKSKVKVISISDILKAFEQNDSRNLGLTVEAGNIKNLYKNKFVPKVPSGIARINNVLAEMHKRKVSISFNSSLLQHIK